MWAFWGWSSRSRRAVFEAINYHVHHFICVVCASARGVDVNVCQFRVCVSVFECEHANDMPTCACESFPFRCSVSLSLDITSLSSSLTSRRYCRRCRCRHRRHRLRFGCSLRPLIGMTDARARQPHLTAASTTHREHSDDC